MGRICMVAYSFYESDNRIIRYADSLAGRGDEVHVLALASAAALPQHELRNGVHLHRLQLRLGKQERSRWAFLWPLLRFTAAAARWFMAPGRPRFDLVHVHNIPDFLVFAAAWAKLRGARVILDIHDVSPEFFASKFGASPRSLVVRALLLMERLSAAMADKVILANHLWLARYAARSARADKCIALINHVDETVFRPRPARPPACSRDKVIVFPGGLQPHQGLDIAIRAFALLRQRLANVRFDIYGDGSARDTLLALIGELGLHERVRIHAPVALSDVARLLAQADLGVVPKRADSFGNEAYSTKIMEFMAVGLPVVVSSTRVDRHYFDDSVVRFFPSGDAAALADAMHELLSNEARSAAMAERARAYVACHGWSNHKHAYLDLVDGLVAPAGARRAQTAP